MCSNKPTNNCEKREDSRFEEIDKYLRHHFHAYMNYEVTKLAWD